MRRVERSYRDKTRRFVSVPRKREVPVPLVPFRRLRGRSSRKRRKRGARRVQETPLDKGKREEDSNSEPAAKATPHSQHGNRHRHQTGLYGMDTYRRQLGTCRADTSTSSKPSPWNFLTSSRRRCFRGFLFRTPSTSPRQAGGSETPFGASTAYSPFEPRSEITCEVKGPPTVQSTHTRSPLLGCLER